MDLSIASTKSVNAAGQVAPSPGPSDDGRVYLNAPRWFKDTFEIADVNRVEYARKFIESSSPVLLPHPAPVQFQRVTRDVGRSINESQNQAASIPLVRTFAFSYPELVIAANENAVAGYGFIGSPLYLEKTLVHEWVHAAQNFTFPNIDSDLLSTRNDLLAQRDTTLNEVNAMPPEERFRAVGRMNHLTRKMNELIEYTKCYEIVHEGHAVFVESLYYNAEKKTG